MQQRLEQFGGTGECIVFAHANGYPPGSYRQFLGHLVELFNVAGFHQRPLWSPEMAPQRLDWQRFVDDLIETLVATQQDPVWMMGHSMGATISTLAAAKRPELFKGLILIDPVFMSSRRVLRSMFTPEHKMRQWPLVRKTLGRPDRFASTREAFDFHRGKRVFAGFSDTVLWDYVRAATRLDRDGELQLAYARDWEAAAYKSTPWVWPAIAKVKLPVLGLRGEDSDTLTSSSFKRWRKLQRQAELHDCPGGHLLPMEHPQGTARYVIDFLQSQAH